MIKILLSMLLIMITTQIYSQDSNQKYTLAGIGQIEIEVVLVIDEELKEIVKVDESIYSQELTYYLNMSQIKNKLKNMYDNNLPILTLFVRYTPSCGGMDISNKIVLYQNLYFTKAKKKVSCITWNSNESVLYLREKWNLHFHTVLMNSIDDQIKAFIADYMDVNNY